MKYTASEPMEQERSAAARAAATQAVEFLERLDPAGWHNLVGLDPNEVAPPIAKTFPPGCFSEIASWVEQWSGRRNLYYTANEVRPGHGDRKPNKADIGAIRALYVDVDPRADAELGAERTRIQGALRGQSPLAFSEVVDSGGGYQALAILSEKMEASEDTVTWAERYGRALGKCVGSDPVQNVDRVLRLPGPPNVPTKAKIAKGRTRRNAAVAWSADLRYDRAAISAAIPADMLAPSLSLDSEDRDIAELMEELRCEGFEEADAFDSLPEDLRSRFQSDCEAHPALKRVWDGEIKNTKRTGSDYRVALSAALKRAGGYTGLDYARLAYVWPWAVQRGDDRDHKLTCRQLARDWVRIGNATPEPNPRDHFMPIEDATSDQAGWGEPFDIFGAAEPLNISTPPAGSLPAVLDRWAESESRRKGVSKAFAAAAALAVVAGAVGNGLTVCPRMHDTDWRIPCCLWVALVDDPGGGKSPIISAALRPLRELDGARYGAGKAALERWENEHRGKKRMPNSAPPRIPRSLVDDATMEKLIALFEENPRGLMQTPDELAQVFGALGAYKANSSADRSQLLRLFDGGGITVDRVGGGTKRASRALLSILAGTQPDRIGKSAKDLGTDGMLQRFLFVVGDSVDRGGGEDVEPDRKAAGDYASLVKYLAQAEFGQDSVRLTQGAYDTLENAKRQIQSLARYPGAPVALEGHLAKWAGILPRIALAFHAVALWEAQEVLGYVPLDTLLERGTAARAVAFGRFLLRHSLAFYARNFDVVPKDKEARAFAGYLLTHPEKVDFTRRDVGQAQRSLRDHRAAIATMRRLEDVAWVRAIDRDADGTSRWAVNPSIHTRFQERAASEASSRKRRQQAIAEAGRARTEWLASETIPTGDLE